MAPFDEPEMCRNILDSLPTGVCVVDMDKRIRVWSDGAERITGHLRHEVIGNSCVAEPLLHCDQPGCEFCSQDCPIARAIRSSQAAEATGVLHHKQGHEIPVRIRAVPIHNKHGSIIGAVESFEEIQPAVGADRAGLLHQSPDCVDNVTGIASRLMMHLHLRQTVVACADGQFAFGVLLLQVEGLSHFRSNLGPEAAYALLRVMARTLESSVNRMDLVGRWTDDQFLIILNGVGEEALHAVRERIRRTIAGEGIEWWGERRSLPVSIGETTAQTGDTAESVLQRVQKSVETASAWHSGAAGASDHPLGGS
jgi:diguanylate cyclase (GGDEF)-like protein/PAS domain S-box-containing protein